MYCRGGVDLVTMDDAHAVPGYKQNFTQPPWYAPRTGNASPVM